MKEVEKEFGPPIATKIVFSMTEHSLNMLIYPLEECDLYEYINRVFNIASRCEDIERIAREAKLIMEGIYRKETPCEQCTSDKITKEYIRRLNEIASSISHLTTRWSSLYFKTRCCPEAKYSEVSD
jgi:uncharacterized protein Yka (UPF0111/DUF47 family)